MSLVSLFLQEYIPNEDDEEVGGPTMVVVTLVLEIQGDSTKYVLHDMIDEIVCVQRLVSYIFIIRALADSTALGTPLPKPKRFWRVLLAIVWWTMATA